MLFERKTSTNDTLSIDAQKWTQSELDELIDEAVLSKSFPIVITHII